MVRDIWYMMVYDIWCYDIWWYMMWYMMIWCDVIYDVSCREMWDVWCVFYDTWYVMRSDAMWYIWCDIWWCDVIYDVLCRVVRCVMCVLRYVIRDAIRCDVMWCDVIYDIFVNCSCVDTRWRQYSTHLHTNNTQNNTINNKIIANWEECRPRPVFVSYTLAFALQLRKKHGKPSVRVAEEFHSFLTSALDRGERLTARSGRFTCGKESRHPSNTKLGGPQSRRGRSEEQKHLSPRTVQTLV